MNKLIVYKETIGEVFMKPKKFKEIIPVMKASVGNYERIMTKISKELGLSFSEAHVLLFFNDNNEFINAKDIVFCDNVSKSFVSKAIKSLLEKNYIKIIVDESDKRYQKIILNNNTKDMIKKLECVRVEYKNYLVKDLTNEELEGFFKVLEKIENNIMNYENEGFE